MQKNKLKIIFQVEEKPLLDIKFVINKDSLDKIAMILSQLKNMENEIILVSAGAIISGIEKLKLAEYPVSKTDKQAVAALGQVELIRRYQNIFDEYNQMVGQVLLDRNVTDNPKRKQNAKNTFARLLEMNVIPIINENDTTSTVDIELESNFTLATNVANIVMADIIITLKTGFAFKILKRGATEKIFIKDTDSLFDYIKRNSEDLLCTSNDIFFASNQ